MAHMILLFICYVEYAIFRGWGRNVTEANIKGDVEGLTIRSAFPSAA